MPVLSYMLPSIRRKAMFQPEATLPSFRPDSLRVRPAPPLLQDALKRIAEEFPLPEVGPPTFVVDGIKSLPIYVCKGQALDDIPAMSSGRVRFIYEDPSYDPPDYKLESVGEEIGKDPQAAIKAVKAWRDHLFKFIRFVQFKDDPSRKLIRALNAHTELVTTLCDARLGIDPTEVWQSFDTLMGFEAVHSDYRATKSGRVITLNTWSSWRRRTSFTLNIRTRRYGSSIELSSRLN